MRIFIPRTTCVHATTKGNLPPVFMCWNTWNLSEGRTRYQRRTFYLSQPLCYTSLTLSQIIPRYPASVRPHEISRLLRCFILTIKRPSYPHPHSAANKLTQIYLSSLTHQFYRPNPSGTVCTIPSITLAFRHQIRQKLPETLSKPNLRRIKYKMKYWIVAQ